MKMFGTCRGHIERNGARKSRLQKWLFFQLFCAVIATVVTLAVLPSFILWRAARTPVSRASHQAWCRMCGASVCDDINTGINIFDPLQAQAPEVARDERVRHQRHRVQFDHTLDLEPRMDASRI
jgi:hypothetical protein